MKNKILKKIILVVSCVTVLVSAFVIPSFAATGDYGVSYESVYDKFWGSGSGGYGLLPSYSHLQFVPQSTNYTDAFKTNKAAYYVPAVVDAPFDNASYSSFTKTVDDTTTISFNTMQRNIRYGAYDTMNVLGYDVGINTTSNEIGDSVYYENLWFYFQFNHEPQDSDFNSFNNCLFLNTPKLSQGTTVDLVYYASYLDWEGNFVTVLEPLEVTVSAYPSSDSLYSQGITLYFLPSSIMSNADIRVLYEVQFDIYTSDISPNGEQVLQDMSTTVSNSTYFGRNHNVIRYLYRCSMYIVPLIQSREDLDSLIGDFAVGEYNRGLDEGYTEGFEEGYTEGYDTGISIGSSGSPFEVIISAVNSFINWEFIPGVSVGIVLSIVIGVSLLIAFLKIFAGG